MVLSIIFPIPIAYIKKRMNECCPGPFMATDSIGKNIVGYYKNIPIVTSENPIKGGKYG